MNRTTHNLLRLPPLDAFDPSVLPSPTYTPSLPSIRQLKASGIIPDTIPTPSHQAHIYTDVNSPHRPSSPTDAPCVPNCHPNLTSHVLDSTPPRSSSPHMLNTNIPSTSTSVLDSSVLPPRVQRSSSQPCSSNTLSFGPKAHQSTATSSSAEPRSGVTVSTSPTNTYFGKQRNQSETVPSGKGFCKPVAGNEGQEGHTA